MPMVPKTPAGARTYRTAAFAALAGVTPRALRHYDRLGLLKPRRTTAGYRIYTERDSKPSRRFDGRDGQAPVDAEAAFARASQWSESYASPEVLEFIQRLRAARIAGAGHRQPED